MARRLFDRLRKSFYRLEAKNPSFKYTEEELASLGRGAAAREGLQLDHLRNLSAEPADAFDPMNIVYQRGGARGALPKGSPHYTKTRAVPPPRGKAPKAEEKLPPEPKPSVEAKLPEPKPGVEPKPPTEPETPPVEMKPPPEVTLPEGSVGPKVPRSGSAPVGEGTWGAALESVLAELRGLVILMVINYILEKWHAEAEERRMKSDWAKKVEPQIAAYLANPETQGFIKEQIPEPEYKGMTLWQVSVADRRKDLISEDEGLGTRSVTVTDSTWLDVHKLFGLAVDIPAEVLDELNHAYREFEDIAAGLKPALGDRWEANAWLFEAWRRDLRETLDQKNWVGFRAKLAEGLRHARKYWETGYSGTSPEIQQQLKRWDAMLHHLEEVLVAQGAFPVL